jgi:hypothetical protein
VLVDMIHPEGCNIRKSKNLPHLDHNNHISCQVMADPEEIADNHFVKNFS